MFRSSSRLLASLTLGLMGGVVLLADGAQTGTLAGVVKDEKGMPISGAAIRITGTTLMGERLLTATEDGSFRAPSLPPGSSYEVTVVADGYQTAKVPARVGVNQVFRMTIALQPIAASVVEVVAIGSSIDTTTVSSPTNMNREMIDSLPIPGGRDYQAVMALTPGLVGAGNPSALGGFGNENLYLLDGVDTTDATSGTFSMNLNQDAIEEIQVLTTGLSAEYGRFGGAVANVVSKSGGNIFEGGLRYDFFNLAWDAQGKLPERPESEIKSSVFLSLGGPLVKDKLWFFVTAEKDQSDETNVLPTGQTYARQFDGDPAWYSAKLTWQINPNHSLVLQSTGDPTHIKNEDLGYRPGNVAALGDQKQGVNFQSLTYRAVPRQDLTFDAKIASYAHTIEVIPNSESAISFGDSDAGYVYHNSLQGEYNKRKRSQMNIALTWYPTSHQVKMGLDHQSSKSALRAFIPGGQKVFYSKDYLDFELTEQLTYENNESKQGISALYINDSWRINNHWVANLGVRFEKTNGKNDVGTEIWDYSGVSPRLGLTYDWKGDSRQSLGAHFARYMIVPKQDVLDQLAAKQNWYVTHYNFSGNPGTPEISIDEVLLNPNSYGSHEEWTNGTPTSDKDLEAGYVDEWVLSYKSQVTDRLTLNAQGIMRDYRNQMLLFTSFFENPNDPTQAELVSTIKNAKDSKREYRAFIGSLEYQGEQWMLRASYSYSSLHGNYDIASMTSYGRFLEGDYQPRYNDARKWGRLDADQPHAFQLLASHRFDVGKWDFSQGLLLKYTSGRVWTLNARWLDKEAPPYALFDNRYHLITENGEWGDRQFSSRFRLNYSFNVAYSLPASMKLRFGIDILNILNHYRMESFDTRTERADIDANGVVDIVKHPKFGTTLPGDYTPGRQIRFTTALRF